MKTDLKDITVADWLHEKFLAWEAENGRRATTLEFAEWLRVPHDKLSTWMNGKQLPIGINIFKLSVKLDSEIWDILGFLSPITDPLMLKIVKEGDILDEERRAVILELYEKIRDSDDEEFEEIKRTFRNFG